MNIYGARTDADTIDAPLVSLNILYEGMPETTGCNKCQEVNGDNAYWCCKTQSPSMHYIEFLRAWREVQSWDKSKKANVVISCIRNYLSNESNKGCVFYDCGCTIYEDRPFACRMYGIVPEENWNKRWDSLKDRDGDKFSAVPQCDLVSTVDNKPVSADSENKWFAHIVKTEERIGVSKIAIRLHDEPGGSYRTFHDHILMEIFPSQTLDILTQVKLTNPSKDDIEETAEVLWNSLSEAGVL